MKNPKIIIVSFLISLMLTCTYNAGGQALNINGDTVFVNAEAEFRIILPTLPRSFSTFPRDAQYDLKSIDNAVVITARTETAAPATLLISEGGRNHSFKLVFKKEINFDNPSELDYNYSTLKIIEAHTKNKPRLISPPQGKDVVSGAGNVAVNTNPSVAQVNSIDNYSVKMASAKTFFDQKNYAKSKEAYEQALASRPGDLNATTQIEKINGILHNEGNANNEKLYKEYIAQGEAALTKIQLSAARIAYQQALLTRPNDLFATGRLKLIDEKENQQTQNEELEIKFNAAVQSADRFFQAGDYGNAKAEYNRALTFLKKPGPQEQIAKIEKLLADQKNQEQQKLLEINYDDAAQAADDFFKAGEYENAKKKYFEALSFIKKDWPQDQINKINKTVAAQEAQEIEHKYSAAMEGADKYFMTGDYKNSKIMYNRAIGLIDKPEPRQKIKEIDKIFAEQAAKADAEKKRIAQEAEITFKYAAIIKNADIEFDKKNYNKAKQIYAQASAIKPAEEYPKERLIEIDNIKNKTALEEKAKKDSIASAKEISTKYNQAISKAKVSYGKNDLLTAKRFYEEAYTLKPEQETPNNQLKIINDKLAVLARENELNKNYEDEIALADIQVVAKAYDSAIVLYNEAMKLKPAEGYPKKQLKYIQSELAGIDRREGIKKVQEEEVKYNKAITTANKASEEKRYSEAKTAFTEALSIHPENETIKTRLKNVSFQLEKEDLERMKQQSSKDSAAMPSKGKKGKKNKVVITQNKKADAQKQAAPIVYAAPVHTKSLPYTPEELKSKYPNIDFFSLPPEQPFNKSAIESDKTLQMCNKMLAEKPRLNLSSNGTEIKVICQAINFEETTSYIKLLVQNYSKTDFLTGAMMLSWTKKTGNHIKLYPNHLFPAPLPVIKPGDEAFIIYACKTYEILSEEMLSFELIDRLKKFKLQVKIPGSVYNEEWVRYE